MLKRIIAYVANVRANAENKKKEAVARERASLMKSLKDTLSELDHIDERLNSYKTP